MSLTTDPNDPRLTRGVDSAPVSQAAVYLVLSEEERAKGFVRPVRRSYIHIGEQPDHPLRVLTDEEKATLWEIRLHSIRGIPKKRFIHHRAVLDAETARCQGMQRRYNNGSGSR